MPLLFRIAYRNLWEHKGKTLIIGIIVALGVVVLLVGNSLMDTASDGIERAFIGNYTGHVMISGIADGDVSLFGVATPSVGGIVGPPVIPEYDRVREFASGLERVEQSTAQITGFGILRLEGEQYGDLQSSAFSLLFGIEPDTYEQMFRNIRILEGDYLQPGEVGLMLSTDRVDELEKSARESMEEAGIADAEIEISAGDDIRIVGLSSGGALPKIRVVPLRAIYEPVNPTEGVGNEFISYVDAQTQRALLDLRITYQGEFDLEEGVTSLLDMEEGALTDFDALFAAPADGGATETADLAFADPLADPIEDPFADPFADPLTGSAETAAPSGDGATIDYDSILGDLSERDRALEIDTGAWQYILLRLDRGRNDRRVIEQLNEWFQQEGIAAQAADWEAAAGPFATTADVIRTVFNIAIIIIGVVAVIIIMNTLVISVIERTAEIGTMRALGAQRSFVWRMFLAETAVITVTFGTIGILVGVLVIGVLNWIGIPATNTFLQVLFAGPELHPSVSLSALVLSIVVVGTIAVVSHLYPVSVALKIAPVRAIQTE